jgi:hypothetical protein
VDSSSKRDPADLRVTSVRPRSRSGRSSVARRALFAATLLGLLAGAACTNPMALEHTTSSGNHTTSSGNLDEGGLEVS